MDRQTSSPSEHARDNHRRDSNNVRKEWDPLVSSKIGNPTQSSTSYYYVTRIQERVSDSYLSTAAPCRC